MNSLFKIAKFALQVFAVTVLDIDDLDIDTDIDINVDE